MGRREPFPQVSTINKPPGAIETAPGGLLFTEQRRYSAGATFTCPGLGSGRTAHVPSSVRP
jgi:hypothetical protein